MKIFVALTFMLFLVGCVENDKTSQIPSGIYTSSEPNSEEKVEVKGSKIVFHIKRPDGTFWNSREYDYSVNPDGEIKTEVLSSNENFFIYGRCKWTFDGKVIWKEDIKTGKKVSFIKKE